MTENFCLAPFSLKFPNSAQMYCKNADIIEKYVEKAVRLRFRLRMLGSRGLRDLGLVLSAGYTLIKHDKYTFRWIPP